VPGHGAVATVAGHRAAVGSPRLLEREGVPLAGLATRREELAGTGRTTVLVAVDGRPAGLIALADAPRPTAPAAVRALHDLGVEVVMLTGDNQGPAGGDGRRRRQRAGVFEPAFGLVLRPEIAALSMSGSSFLVAVNALMLKRLRLPQPPAETGTIPATLPAHPTPVG
jgi:cation transport ATPase